MLLHPLADAELPNLDRGNGVKIYIEQDPIGLEFLGLHARKVRWNLDLILAVLAADPNANPDPLRFPGDAALADHRHTLHAEKTALGQGD